jgi:hypothetical protein
MEGSGSEAGSVQIITSLDPEGPKIFESGSGTLPLSKTINWFTAYLLGISFSLTFTKFY